MPSTWFFLHNVLKMLLVEHAHLVSVVRSVESDWCAHRPQSLCAHRPQSHLCAGFQQCKSFVEMGTVRYCLVRYWHCEILSCEILAPTDNPLCYCLRGELGRRDGAGEAALVGLIFCWT